MISATLSAAPVRLQILQQGTNLLVSWPTNYSAFGLQFSTNLNSTNWTPVSVTPSQTNTYVVLDPLQAGPRHYRLVSPCGTNAAPYLPVGTFLKLNGNGNGYSITSTSLTNALSVPTLSFDASAFVDPSSCFGNGGLSYAWQLTTNGSPILANVSGLNAARLTITNNSLAAGVYGLNLAVTGSSGLTTNLTLTLTLKDLLPGDPQNPGTTPFLPAGSYIFENNVPMIDGDTAMLADYYPHLTFDLIGLFSTQVDPFSILDVGAVVDPATCDNSSLTYQWKINNSDRGPDLHPFGVAGFNASRLKIFRQSLANGFYDVHVFVTGLTGTSEFAYEFEVRDSNAQFRTPCSTNTAPYLPPGNFVTLNASPLPAVFQLATNVTSVVLDASAFTSPFNCVGGLGLMTFHWALAPSSTNAFTGSVSGADTSVLTIPASSLATGSYIFRLTVTDQFDGSTVQKDYPVQFLRP